MLKDKKILLGVTGGIAAYKACELLRRLQDKGAEVSVAMTSSALSFVGEQTFRALSGAPVYTKVLDLDSPFNHIDKSAEADLLLIAPATANSIAKIVAGMADDPVSICALTSECPTVIVPSMNSRMMQAPATAQNLLTLEQRGIHLVHSETGYLACGETGIGRFPDIANIVQKVEKILASENEKQVVSLESKRVMITAGRTEEDIDPVRFITNKSSGKTAVAVAEAFLERGDRVLAVCGPMEEKMPAGVEVLQVRSATEMHDAVVQNVDRQDFFVMAAAVADLRPANPATEKIKSSRSMHSLTMVENPDILASVCEKKRPAQIVTGFALETNNALKNGREKLIRKKCDFLVLNTPVKKDSGFGKDCVEAAILVAGQNNNSLQLSPVKKSELARQLVNLMHGAHS